MIELKHFVSVPSCTGTVSVSKELSVEVEMMVSIMGGPSNIL